MHVECAMTHCWWGRLPSLDIWTDLSIPSDHVAMISFPYLSFRPAKKTVEVYSGGRHPRHTKRQTDFMFPFLLPGLSVHVRYFTFSSIEGSLFRMLFTFHRVNNIFKGFRPEWYISIIIYSGNIPIWSETLESTRDMFVLLFSQIYPNEFSSVVPR